MRPGPSCRRCGFDGHRFEGLSTSYVYLLGLYLGDGCRFINTGNGGWRVPRYSFSNLSTDHQGIFCEA
jgi:hypothetical protein